MSTPTAQPSRPRRSANVIRRLVIDLPMPINISNSRMHWRVKHNAKRAYFAVCDYLLLAREIPTPPSPKFGRSAITSDMTLGGRMDADNAMARHKWPLDWLQSRGFIANDRDLEWTTVPVQRISRREPGRLTLTLTEL